MWTLLDSCVLVLLFLGRFVCAKDSTTTNFPPAEWFFSEWRVAIWIFLLMLSIVGSVVGGFISSCCNTKKPAQQQNAPDGKQATVQKPIGRDDLFTKAVVNVKDVAPTVIQMPADDDRTICNVAPIKQQTEKELKTGKELKQPSKKEVKIAEVGKAVDENKDKIDKSPAANQQVTPSKPKAKARRPDVYGDFVRMSDVLSTWDSEVDDSNYDPKKRAEEKAEAAAKEKSKKSKKAAAKCNPKEKNSQRKDDNGPPPPTQKEFTAQDIPTEVVAR